MILRHFIFFITFELKAPYPGFWYSFEVFCGETNWRGSKRARRSFESGKEGAKLHRESRDTEMEKLLDIMFHHGGTFKKNDDGKLVYSPDNRSCLGDLDEDTLDVFFVRNYFNELGYDKVVECWWLVPGRSLEVGLRALTSDDELREMCFHAKRNDGVVDVFFEHGVSTPELMEGKRDVMLLDYEVEEFSHGDLQSNKETHVDTSNQTPVDKSTTNPIPNLSTANTIPSTATPIPNYPTADPLTTNPTNEEPNPMVEPGNPKPNYRPNPKFSRKSNPAPIVKHNQKPTPKPKNLLKPKKTYEHHINPLPGQSLWEKSAYSQPQAPNIKCKPGKLTTKRRKDADEADELAAAAAAVAAAKSKTILAESTPAAEVTNTTKVAPQVDEAPPGVAVQNHAQVEVTEIDLSQPNYGGTQDEAPPSPPRTTRPDKLPTKRKNSPSPVSASVDSMQGASAATSSRHPKKGLSGWISVPDHRSTGRFPHPQRSETREALLRLGILVVDRIELPSPSFARPTMVKPNIATTNESSREQVVCYSISS
ncbi:uncharacterized protein DS421_10g307640 [Arachis hypogaea]|nr:uncharacterized protein DS421_10g307640 [Arachis hypogaea]